MSKTTIIIPVLEINDNNRELFKNCLESVKAQKDKDFSLAIVTPNEEQVRQFLQENQVTAKIILNSSGKTDYASQINLASEQVDTEYFSVVQMDDVMFPNHVMNINKYATAYPDIDCFNPLVYEVDSQDTAIGFSNETVWAIGNMEKIGFFDIAKTKEKSFYNFNVNCFTVKTETFKTVGKLKPSMKKFGDFEFLLRFLNLGKKAYVIPKMTYKHLNGVKGSIHDQQIDMDELEKRFWYSTSKKEYFFDYDREITYV